MEDKTSRLISLLINPSLLSLQQETMVRAYKLSKIMTKRAVNLLKMNLDPEMSEIALFEANRRRARCLVIYQWQRRKNG